MDTLKPGPSAEVSDTPRHRALASARRVVILHLVRRTDSGLSAGDVAAATGLHLNTVRAHLDQLTDVGLLSRTRQPDGSPGRPAWRYRAATPLDPGVTGLYQELAGALVGHLGRTEEDPHAAGVQAGRAWGRKLAAGAAATGQTAPVERLVQLLDRLGFAPRIVHRDGAASALLVHLHACPFMDLVDRNADVVCGLHQGVIRGALGAMGVPPSSAVLEPFGVPGGCVVRMPARSRQPRTRQPRTAGPGREP